jgi:hypothetical protein
MANCNIITVTMEFRLQRLDSITLYKYMYIYIHICICMYISIKLYNSLNSFYSYTFNIDIE